MALITRCPVCGTLFKVVPDQLRISEGWVRCGHCAEIFDASGDLQQSESEHHTVEAVGAVPEPVEPNVPAYTSPELEPSPEPVPALQELTSEPPLLLAEVPPSSESEPAEMDPPPSQLPSPESIFEVDVRVDAASAPLFAESMGGVDVNVDAIAEEASTTIHVADAETESLGSARADAYSFIREAEPSVVAARPVVYWLAVGASCVLVLLLAMQIVINQRNHLAATWPEIRSGLLSICQPLGCAVDPLQQIESIVIDSSTLSTLQNGEVYRLSLVLKNQARVDLAMPAIEFVLTDIDEQAVSKRVLLPVELGAASRVLFAGREWATSVDLRVTDKVEKARIVGYRLLAFYP